MNSILQDIIAYKKEQLKEQKKLVSVDDLKRQSQGAKPSRFAQALKD